MTSNRTKSIAKLKLANRLVSIDQQGTKKLLDELAYADSENFLFPRQEEADNMGFDAVETFFQSDQSFGRKFLLRSFNSQKGQYAYDFIGSIDKLLKYEQYFDDENIREIYYLSNLQYNRELAKGLPEKEVQYTYLKQHIESLDFYEVVIKYIAGLFDYPVVKVRQLALQSLFDLVVYNPKYLKSVFQFGTRGCSDNQIEYSLILFHAIALENPQILKNFKTELWALTNKRHFAILESVRELLFYLNSQWGRIPF